MATKEAQREYQRQWIARRRAEFFADKLCVKCGSTEKLELDHIDPTTKVHHAIWSWTAARREAEIAKCQVLCKSCHWLKTVEDMKYYEVKHGTSTMYDYQGCRCDPCKAYKKEANAKYRNKHAGVAQLAER